MAVVVKVPAVNVMFVLLPQRQALPGASGLRHQSQAPKSYIRGALIGT
jgi:hypothetical protein